MSQRYTRMEVAKTRLMGFPAHLLFKFYKFLNSFRTSAFKNLIIAVKANIFRFSSRLSFPFYEYCLTHGKSCRDSFKVY